MNKGCINMLKKRKKNGFTLIELLAVIVILAVVILIAVTSVIPRMNNAKKKALLDEALIYLNAGKNAFISDESVECYNIDDLDSYVKQTKNNYDGVLYINGNYERLYLTDGNYYIIANKDGNTEVISKAQPSSYVTSCDDTSNTYTITYDLNGGTVSSPNPTSYNSNTPTITLNNPTKSGYRFVGWTTKNEFDKNNYLDIDTINLKPAGSYYYAIINLKPNTSYIVSIKRYNEFDGIISGANLLISTIETDGTFNVTNKWTAITHRTEPDKSKTSFKYTTGSDGNLYLGRSSVTQSILDTIWKNTDVQIEEGTLATDFQDYMKPSTNAKIFRGSSGNKKFIANWEPL